RYPADFDGLVVGAPALNNSANRLRSIATYQALAKAPIPAAKLKLLADRVYARCDDRDGLKDGLIDDPRRCDFKASRDVPVCPAGDAPGCFTADQIKVLETIYGDVVLNGKRTAPGFPVGAEIAGPNGASGWDGWIMRENGLSQSAVFAESALRFMIFPKPDPAYDLTRFNLERDAHLFDWIGKLMNATDPDLTRFRERGGKILMYFGWSDPALNPLMGVEYYESVLQRMGASTRDFFKLYMLPGVFHCSGGVGPACFDPLTNLIPWVEHGKAPDSIVASRLEGGKVLRTRPLCPYPQVAKYQGQGSIDDASNFRCSNQTKTDAFSTAGPVSRELYRTLLHAVGSLGPCGEEVKKTSIHLLRESAFAGVRLRKQHLVITIKAAKQIRSPRIVKAEQASTSRWYLDVKLNSPGEIDAELLGWLGASYDLSR
ncbi:MAG: tannase/feruloyl esterase family alpha/beta hydrolase, partial [Bryobacteraceae bacterium]